MHCTAVPHGTSNERQPWISTPSSSAPAFPASTSSTGCANSGSRCACSRAGTGVGGTWYWNRYPGARFDSESWTYGYSFSQELLEEWDWEEHFAGQPETERYLNYVADKFDLRRDIQFKSRVSAAHYQEDTRSWDVILEDGRRYTTRFLITAIGVLSAATMPTIPGVETFPGPVLPHPLLAEGTGQLRGQAGRGDRHRRDGHTDHHRSGQDRRPPDRVPAHRPVERAIAQRQDRQGGDGPDPGQLLRDLRALPGDLRLLHPCDRPALHARGDARGARGVLGEALRRARFRHLDGQFPRHPGRPRGQPADLRFRRPQDPRAGQGPGRRREADPEKPRLRHAPRAARKRLLRGLQPAQRRTGRHQRDADRAHHPDRHQDQRRASTNSTSSSTRPVSTRSPAPSTASTSAGSTGCR